MIVFIDCGRVFVMAEKEANNNDRRYMVFGLLVYLFVYVFDMILVCLLNFIL